MRCELFDVVRLGYFTLPFSFFALVECAANGFKTAVVASDEEDRIDVLFERHLCDEASLITSPSVAYSSVDRFSIQGFELRLFRQTVAFEPYISCAGIDWIDPLDQLLVHL